jgi:site-specific recombinase XerD
MLRISERRGRHPRPISAAGLPIASAERKRVSRHAFRHPIGTHLLETGYDIRTMQELLRHKDVSTTMIYTHVLNKGATE